VKRDAVVEHEMDPEVTVVRKMRPPERIWKTVAFFLGLILSGGAILGTVGKAFYVTREEYTTKVRDDDVLKMNLQMTLEGLKQSMANQEKTINTISDTVYNIKLDMRARQK
jgi:hypothetical protein